ncbi:MAG TPA: M48 family metallopeptidase [Gemmatimonadaceae bacterium]|nr:M48 family metallopeptidase [Gemmatimonadaceae bacterium]
MASHPRPRILRHPRRAALRLLAAAAILPLAACDVSEQEELELGRQTAGQIAAQLPVVDDPATTAYLGELGRALAAQTDRPGLDWRFFLVNSGEVNAFAVPGGYVYVNRGLVERAATLSEFAGVLGHEVAHVGLRHSAEQLESQRTTGMGVTLICTLTGWCESGTAQVAINLAGSAWFARHSREDEAEADSASVFILQRAGIDPEGVPRFFERLLQARERDPLTVETWFSSHPLEESRVDASRALVNSISPSELEGLVQDDAAYQAFRRRVAALPPPPPPPPQLR